MATEVLEGPLGEIRAASTAAGGTALTTTAVRIPLPRATKQITLIPRNFSTAVVAQILKNPFLNVIKTTDLLATVLTDMSDAAQDNDTATDVVLSSLDTLLNLNALYIGSHVPFGGFEIDVDLPNANAATLLVEYWNGAAWVDLSASDGTASGGATMAIDGNITWSVPAAWAPSPLEGLAVPTAKKHQGLTGTDKNFWVRVSVSAALDSSTTLNSLIAINRSTAYAEIPSGMWYGPETVTVGPGGIYSIQAKVDAGTANLIVDVATRSGGRF